MSDMLKITAAQTVKSYASPSKPLADSNTVFNLADLGKIVKTNDRSSEFRETENTFASDQNAILNNELKLAKDTSFLSKILSDFIGQDGILSQEQIPDASSKEFNEFVKNIFLSGESLTDDLVAQEKGVTTFKGELFSMLRNLLASSNSEEATNSISCFLRSFATLSSQKEILNSISANLKSLSQLLSPSKTLSENLLNISKLFASDKANINFESLKGQAIELLNSASTSLIVTDKMSNLISLIKYNLSRFSDNPNTLMSNFNDILSLVTDEATKQHLTNAFEKMLEGSNIPFPTKAALLAENNSYLSSDKLTFQIAESIEKNEIAMAEGFKNNTVIELVNLLNESESIDLNDGVQKIKDLLSLIVPKENQEQLSELLDKFKDTKDLNSLINRIRYMLNQVSSQSAKEQLASSINKILTALSHSPDITYQPPTSLETLVEFMQKSLGNQNIKYLGMVDPNALIQNMLTAPGVFAPLMHHVIPFKLDDMRSFGELWIDPDCDDSNSDKKSSHFFLTFDIENQGLFELEIFSSDTDLDISLYCPKKFVKPLSAVKQSIQTVALAKGFNIKASKVSELKKAHTLTQIFPSVEKRRSGLDVTI